MSGNYRSTQRRLVSYAMLIFFALIYLAPFLIQTANSFKTDPDATANGISLVPHPPTLSAWNEIFGITSTGVTDFPRWLFNKRVRRPLHHLRSGVSRQPRGLRLGQTPISWP